MPSPLEISIDYHFTQAPLLELALTHPSKKKQRGDDYQRLEFLGDSVLGLAIADLLYNHFPKELEGELARRKAQLVSSDMLITIAHDIQLDSAIISSNIVQQDARSIKYMEDALEALIGAIYLDGGWAAAQTVIHHLWQPKLHAQTAPPKDPKTALQEWAQGRGLPLPTYTVITHDGPAHQPHFTVEVSVQDNGSAQGEGTSKRAASSDAAQHLFSQLEAPSS